MPLWRALNSNSLSKILNSHDCPELFMANGWLLKPYLAVLNLLVYSRSSALVVTFLSLYGFVLGVASVPRKRAAAAKSLMHYGVDVLQHGLGASLHGSVDTS
jgi:hypothetical protein